MFLTFYVNRKERCYKARIEDWVKKKNNGPRVGPAVATDNLTMDGQNKR